MPRPMILAVLILAVAILAFAGLAYQTVPVSTTQTITQESTLEGASYSPYMETNIVNYTISTGYASPFTLNTYIGR